MHHLGMLPQSHTVEDLLDLAVWVRTPLLKHRADPSFMAVRPR